MFFASLQGAVLETALAGQEAERLGQVVTVCGKCHGAGGVSNDPNIPSLAGQDRAYLENQLKEFRKKPVKELEQFQLHLRDSHVMDVQASRFNANDMAAISRHYSKMRCPTKHQVSIETSLSRCGECHGDDGLIPNCINNNP